MTCRGHVGPRDGRKGWHLKEMSHPHESSHLLNLDQSERFFVSSPQPIKTLLCLDLSVYNIEDFPWVAHIRRASRQSPYSTRVQYDWISGEILTYAPTRSALDTAPLNTEYLLQPIHHQRYLRKKRFS
jgi:hypothetical protein